MNKIEKKKVKSRARCFVSGCTNSKNRSPNISFHEFPKKGTRYLEIENYFGNKEKVDRHDLWLKALDLNRNSDVSHLLVCSAHFIERDYHFAGIGSIKQCLKTTAIPSKNLPTDSRKSALKERNEARRIRSEKRKATMKKKDIESSKSDKTEQSSSPNNIENEGASGNFSIEIDECNLPISESSYTCELDKETLVNSISENNNLHKEEDTSTEVLLEIAGKISDETLRRDIGVQVETKNCNMPFVNLIKSDKNLFTLCGIASVKILNEIVSLMDEIYPSKKKRVLDTKSQVILVMMKLKLDISFSVLNVLFYEVSLATCSLLFHDVLKKLSNILQAALTPVSKSEILNNMPYCFKNFENTVIVLDCTEIPIQKPKCLKCRIKLYSQYKSNFTFKFMTGVTPGGLLTYVSKSYGGRASDKAIFEQSNVLQYLERNRDAIMVDKGFLIDDICAAHGIQLIRPPFLRSKKQFSEEEAILNRQIAAARVHVERMNQRIRVFDVLNNVLDWNLWNEIDDIFIVCCGFANLNTPILGDDKFM